MCGSKSRECEDLLEQGHPCSEALTVPPGQAESVLMTSSLEVIAIAVVDASAVF